MIRFNCPSCGTMASAPEDCAGRTTRCRQCKQPLTVPEPAPPPPRPPAPGGKAPGGTSPARPATAPRGSPPPPKMPARSPRRPPAQLDEVLPIIPTEEPAESFQALTPPRPAGRASRKAGRRSGKSRAGLYAGIGLAVLVVGGGAAFGLVKLLQAEDRPPDDPNQALAHLMQPAKDGQVRVPADHSPPGVETGKSPAERQPPAVPPGDGASEKNTKPDPDRRDKPDEPKRSPPQAKPPDPGRPKSPGSKAPSDPDVPKVPGPEPKAPDRTPPKAPVTHKVRGLWTRLLAVSRDGKLLATGEAGGKVRVWELPGLKQKWVFQVSPNGQVETFALAPDGKTLAAVNRDSAAGDVVKLYDLTTGKEAAALPAQGGGINALAFSRDGKLLASGGRDIRLWDREAGKEKATFKDAHLEAAHCLAFTPDGLHLISGGGDRRPPQFKTTGEVKVWDVDTGEAQVLVRGLPGAVHRLALGGDARLLAAGYGEYGAGGVLRWDLAAGKELPELKGGREFGGLAFSPDDKRLAVAWPDNTIRLFEAATAKELGGFKGPGEMAGALLFTPDGRTLIATGLGELTLWDRRAARPLEAVRNSGNLPGGGDAAAGPDLHGGRVQRAVYPEATVKGLAPLRVRLEAGGKEVSLALARGTAFLDRLGRPVPGAESGRVLAVGNVVTVQAVKTKDGEEAREVRLVRPVKEPVGTEHTWKGVTAAGRNLNLFYFSDGGKQFDAELPPDARVLDRSGKELTGKDREDVFRKGNVLDVTTYRSDRSVNRLFREVRLVREAKESSGRTAQARAPLKTYEGAVVVHRWKGALLDPVFKVGDREVHAAPNAFTRGLGTDGRPVRYAWILWGEGNVVDLTVQRQGDQEVITEIRLVKGKPVASPPTPKAADAGPGPPDRKGPVAGARRLLGTWQEGQRGSLRVYWIIRQEKGQWSVLGVCLRDGKLAGWFRGKDGQYRDNSLTFTQEWVRKPVRSYGDRAAVTVRPRGMMLVFTWRNGPAQGRGNLIPSKEEVPADILDEIREKSR